MKMRLKVDLTKYNAIALIDSCCLTVPGFKCSMWGSLDRFVAVRFNDGSMLDVLWDGLEKVE
jgi:hypothetical protein